MKLSKGTKIRFGSETAPKSRLVAFCGGYIYLSTWRGRAGWRGGSLSTPRTASPRRTLGAASGRGTSRWRRPPLQQLEMVMLIIFIIKSFIFAVSRILISTRTSVFDLIQSLLTFVKDNPSASPSKKCLELNKWNHYLLNIHIRIQDIFY